MLYRKTHNPCFGLRHCQVKELKSYGFWIVTSILIFQIIVIMSWVKFIDLRGDQFPVIIYWPPMDETNIQCYGDNTNDALQSVEDPGFSPKSKSIFFHETSCRGGIDSRQACAVESAARANPEWEVYLLFTAPVTDVMMKRSCLMKLLQFPNIRLARIHVNRYAKYTIVQPIVKHRLWKSAKPVQDAADIMKMLTLHKWGGMSIDLDVLVMKSLNYLPKNWIAKESPFRLASGVMRFSKDAVGLNLTNQVLREIASMYDGDSFNDTSAIERVLMRNCKNALNKSGDCEGISIFSHKWFYPIPMSKAHKMLKMGPSPLDQVKDNHLYTFCMWNVDTGFRQVDQNSAYANMAKNLCPTIYEMFGNEFGV